MWDMNLSNITNLFNPIILFLYYVSVVLITIFTNNPIILVFSLIGGILFFAMMTAFKPMLKDLVYYFLVFILISIINPLFSHNGESILFFLNDNPVTLEAIIYGIAIGIKFVSIFFWSKSYIKIMTSDKFVYLFGRLIPKMSLILSMFLRFIPTFKEQKNKINKAQKTLGLYTSNSITDRIFSRVRVFDSVLTWSFENAVHKSDSMKARGYGLKGRTNFSLFEFQIQDTIVLLIILAILSIVIGGFAFNIFDFYYYPVISSMKISKVNIFGYGAIFVLMVMPFIIEVKENIQWKLLESKI